jgi:hypothetical protein
MFVQGLFGCAMRGLITVERDFKRQSALTPESKPEEGFGRGEVPLGAQQEADGSSLLVDGTVEIGPASFDFDVSRRRARTVQLAERSGSRVSRIRAHSVESNA